MLIKIRQAIPQDAEALSTFIAALDAESDYLLYEKNERNINLQVATDYLTQMAAQKKSGLFIALDELKQIVGFICGEVRNLTRITHVMKINIGLLPTHQKQGIATQLCEQMSKHAAEVGIKRLEVTVITKNTASLTLCLKMGMEIEGVKRASIKIKEQFYDEYLLAKLLF